MNAISIRHLTKRYKNIVALNDLNLDIEQGELFALLGVNGAGKTTTIKILSCLLQPSGGDAYIFDNSITKKTSNVKSIISISPQETAIAQGLTVRENLELMCGVHGFNKNKTKTLTEKLIEQFQLSGVINQKAGKLSGGWQRRLSIAMALIGEPRVLFLDEPTLGLDVIARSELWDVIRELKGEITIVLTTHYMEEAESLSDRIGVMKDGRLIALGTSGELKEKTGKDRFEEAFIALVRGKNI